MNEECVSRIIQKVFTGYLTMRNLKKILTAIDF